jgi:hypothetical protein
MTGQTAAVSAAREPTPAELQAMELDRQQSLLARQMAGAYPDPEKHNRLPGVDVSGSLVHRPRS